ncbi:MAG TPA: response regulator [Anaerolineales bacterium]|nr:response regulator [Anaerolineales bacterium]
MAKILIVDDDKQITFFLEKLLSFEGYAAIALNEGSKTLDVARTFKPDLFILDLMMPEPNGFELCRMLRADPDFANTPIVIITAMDDADSKAIAFVAGATDFITKPFRPDELATRMKALISSSD